MAELALLLRLLFKNGHIRLQPLNLLLVGRPLLGHAFLGRGRFAFAKLLEKGLLLRVRVLLLRFLFQFAAPNSVATGKGLLRAGIANILVTIAEHLGLCVALAHLGAR